MTICFNLYFTITRVFEIKLIALKIKVIEFPPSFPKVMFFLSDYFTFSVLHINYNKDNERPHMLSLKMTVSIMSSKSAGPKVFIFYVTLSL